MADVTVKNPGPAVAAAPSSGSAPVSAVVLLFAFLVSSPALAAPVELVLWHSYTGIEREAFDEILAGFSAAHPSTERSYDSEIPKIWSSTSELFHKPVWISRT